MNRGASISIQLRPIYRTEMLRVNGVTRYRARNVVAAILKRLMHRMSNVQLYTLTLAESLTKNCGIELHREIASRAFTQALEKLITDRVCTSSARHTCYGSARRLTEVGCTFAS